MRILIVEDSEELANLIFRYLSPLTGDMPPTIALTMAQAMAVIDTAEPLDLVTVDLSLPDSTREQTLNRIREIKAQRPDCLLIVITGSVMPNQEQEAIEYGADGYIHKSHACRSSDTFLGTLRDIAKSIMRVPSRYQKNLELAERLTQKICEHISCPITTTPQPQ